MAERHFLLFWRLIENVGTQSENNNNKLFSDKVFVKNWHTIRLGHSLELPECNKIAITLAVNMFERLHGKYCILQSRNINKNFVQVLCGQTLEQQVSRGAQRDIWKQLYAFSKLCTINAMRCCREYITVYCHLQTSNESKWAPSITQRLPLSLFLSSAG